MDSFRSKSTAAALAPADPPAGPLQAHLSAVYALTQSSPCVFASPLGPFSYGNRLAYLPRFVFFGPGASDESWRLAFLGGFDQCDLRASHALLALVELLAREVETSHGLHLTVFPIIDAAGAFLGAPYRGLAAYHWGRASAPELDLLEKDARLRSYHGFIRIETAPPGDDVASVRICGPVADQLSPDLELIATEDTEPFPVRFEAGLTGKQPVAGPLSVADDLPFTPFELTLRIPAAWPDELYQRAAGHLLQRFLWRHRAFQAYAQHL